MSAVPNTYSLYIDTNVYLNFLSYSHDDLQKLSELEKLLRLKKVRLFLPQQTTDEIVRKREDIIEKTLSDFQKPPILQRLPRIIEGINESEAFIEKAKAAEKAKSLLVDKVRSQALAFQLNADASLNSLRDSADRIETNDGIFWSALQRHRSGNPPGKGGSMGDELIWESLLSGCPVGDLHMVTQDNDYRSKLDIGQPKAFLQLEWERAKQGKLLVHSTITDFFKSINVDVIFKSDQDKAVLVEQLSNSKSFSQTHATISSLKPVMDLITEDDAETLFSAEIVNNQISLILLDDDVKSFYIALVVKYPTAFFSEEIASMIGWHESPDDDEDDANIFS